MRIGPWGSRIERRHAICGLGRALQLAVVAEGVGACAPPATVEPGGAAPTRSVLAAPITIPIFDADTHRRTGCYPAGAHQVKFRITTLDSDDADREARRR